MTTEHDTFLTHQGDEIVVPRTSRTCEHCGNRLDALKRIDAKYCDNLCRQGAYGARVAADADQAASAEQVTYPHGTPGPVLPARFIDGPKADGPGLVLVPATDPPRTLTFASAATVALNADGTSPTAPAAVPARYELVGPVLPETVLAGRPEPIAWAYRLPAYVPAVALPSSFGNISARAVTA